MAKQKSTRKARSTQKAKSLPNPDLTLLNELLTYLSTCEDLISTQQRNVHLHHHNYTRRLTYDAWNGGPHSERKWRVSEVNANEKASDKEVGNWDKRRVFVREVVKEARRVLGEEFGEEVVEAMGW